MGHGVRGAVGNFVPEPVVVVHAHDAVAFGLPVSGCAPIFSITEHPVAQALVHEDGALPRIGIGLLFGFCHVDWYPQPYFRIAFMAGLTPGLAVGIYLFRQFTECEHPRGVDENGVAHAPGDGEGLGRGDTHPDGGMRLLKGLGFHAEVTELEELPLKREGFFRPGLLDDLQAFLEPAPTFAEGGVESLVHIWEGSPTDAVLQPSAAQLVQGCGFLGQAYRMAQRQALNGQPHAYLFRAGGDGGGNENGRGQHPARVEVVLRQPY